MDRLDWDEFVRWVAYYRLEALEREGLDPDCPFEPGTPDFSLWQALRNLKAN